MDIQKKSADGSSCRENGLTSPECNLDLNIIITESLAEPVEAHVVSSKAIHQDYTQPSSSSQPIDVGSRQGSSLPDTLYQPLLEDGLDDEATLDDEEKLAEEDEGELDELEKLGEMPIEELLRMYGAPPTDGAGPSQQRTSSKEKSQELLSSCGKGEYVETVCVSSTSGNDDADWTSSSGEEADADVNDEAKKEERLKLLKFLARIGRQSQGSTSDESESDDEEFVPMHLLMLKRETPIGSAYQVEAPEIFPNYDEITSDPTDEILQWAPRVSEIDTIGFLKAAYIQERQLLKKDIPNDQLEQNEVADDEEFLKEFLDCNFDKEEALRRCRRNFRPGRYESSKWSEKECEDFEMVIAENWKRFNIVQAAVPTRTVKEVVEFYYRWKKSSRFEVFLSKIRLPDIKLHHHLEEKIKIRIGKKRPFDAMDAVAEDQLALPESNSSIEPRPKSSRLDNILNRGDVPAEKTRAVSEVNPQLPQLVEAHLPTLG